MSDLMPVAPISALRQRLIDDMTVRRFSRETQRNYPRDVGRFATFLGAVSTLRRRTTFAGSRSSSARPAFPCRR